MDPWVLESDICIDLRILQQGHLRFYRLWNTPFEAFVEGRGAFFRVAIQTRLVGEFQAFIVYTSF